MKEQLKLYMLMLGCTPMGRNTEQHDVYFGIAKNMKELVPSVKAFWSDADDIHIDAWREVTSVDGFEVQLVKTTSTNNNQLYFVNLGGYSHGKFNEMHECHLFVAESLGKAIKKSKETEFYKQQTFPGATSHVDDKFAVDVDDACCVSELISPENLKGLSISLTEAKENLRDDKLHIGYLKIEKLK